jgi:hypothetical protein
MDRPPPYKENVEEYLKKNYSSNPALLIKGTASVALSASIP